MKFSELTKDQRETLRKRFRNLHEEISKRTGLTPAQVATLRVLRLTHRYNKQQIEGFCKEKLDKKRQPGSKKRNIRQKNGTWLGYAGYRHKPAKYYKEIIDYIEKENLSQMLETIKHKEFPDGINV